MEREASQASLPKKPDTFVPGLVKSLYNEEAFKACLRGGSRTLIIEGIAGAGKTTTLTMLTNRLKANWQAKVDSDPGSLFHDSMMVDKPVRCDSVIESPSVPVILEVFAPTSWGESISLVGSIPQLGNWDIRRCRYASSSRYTHQCPVWFVTIFTPPGDRFEYKYIVHKSDGSTVWQEGPNSECVVPHDINNGVSRAWNVESNGNEEAEAANKSKHTDLASSGPKKNGTPLQDGWKIDDIDAEVAVAFVSYDSTKPDQHQPTKIMMSLLLQLIKQIPDAHEVGAHLHKRELTGSNPDFTDIVDAIIKIVARTKAACIIIDALDECAEGIKGDIARTLVEIKRIQAETAVGVVFSQRLTGTDDKPLGAWAIFKDASRFILEAEATTIRYYVQLRLKPFAYTYNWENKDIVSKKIENVVVQSCGGL
jgi:hypothetical protein